MEVAIIGAGIGGLTTALALQRNNIKCTVYESAVAIQPVGAGIIMANNAMQVYRHLGIDDKIRKAGNRISAMKITSPDLSALSVADLTPHEQKYQQHNVAIHRGALQRILIDAVGQENIVLNKRLKDVEEAESGYVLHFEDGTQVNAEYLIGADGIRSKVRSALFEKSELRDSKQICWRGVCKFNVPQQFHHELNEAWGKGKRFGFVRIDDETVYWYALVNTDKANKNSDLPELFRDFHPIANQLMAATPEKDVFYAELFDLKPIAQWNKKNACLVGDAAHATTPNLGQGACQAIEDAYVLGALFRSKQNLADAFSAYPPLRLTKAHHIVNTSWTVGKLAHLDNRFKIGVRNVIMKATPASVMQKQMNKIFTLEC